MTSDDIHKKICKLENTLAMRACLMKPERLDKMRERLENLNKQFLDKIEEERKNNSNPKA